MAEVEGRDSNGRFARGNKCGRGRKISALRKAMLAEMGAGDMKAIIRVLIEKAISGDALTAFNLLDRLVGKPADMVELDIAENGTTNSGDVSVRPIINFGSGSDEEKRK